jgi:Bacteriophage baseplate protein W
MTGALDHVGRGWAFPLRVDARGGIALLEGGEETDASIRMILSTAPGERLMRPDFGCEIWDLVFAPIEPNTLGMMTYAVRRALVQWEPRVELVDVSVEPSPVEDGQVDIFISYRIKATNDVRNLVYPFYVIPKEEQEALGPTGSASASVPEHASVGEEEKT